MNAFVKELENTNTISIKLVGQNFTTGDQYLSRPIPLDFFAKALEIGHEIEVQSLEINGYFFSYNIMSGYKEINQFIETLQSDEYEIDLGVIHALLKETGLTDLKNVFKYAESHVLMNTLNADELGMSDLKEVYGQECSNNALENISRQLPMWQQKQVAQYWNHQQFIDDLFINECKFIVCGKVQVIISNR